MFVMFDMKYTAVYVLLFCCDIKSHESFYLGFCLVMKYNFYYIYKLTSQSEN